MHDLDRKQRMFADLKKFARAEMARDLAHRHGRSLRLPWDTDEAPAPKSEEIDLEALKALGN